MPPAQPLTSPSDRLNLPWNDSLPQPAELTAEIQRLCRAGETDPVGTILARYPELLADRPLIVDLIYEEYLERKKAGGMADAEAFCRRFPAYERSLRNLILTQSFLEKNLDRVTEDGDVPHLAPGEHILGFYVLRELGRGAFAQVLLASEPALGNRLVAIKVSLEGLAEARTLGRLNHPNIVPVFSVQEEPNSGMSVVCMPYLGTATLDDVLDGLLYESTKLPTRARAILPSLRAAARYSTRPSATPGGEEGLSSPVGGEVARVFRHGTYVDGVLHIAVQLAEALEFIHSQGICHRDLKPSNILITPEGRPMLLDFNLSLNKPGGHFTPGPSPKRGGEFPSPLGGGVRGEVGRAGGTPTYMPPEQLRALDQNNRSQRPCLLDERSDLYSLGVILYELLTRFHPFDPIPVGLSPRELIPLVLARQKRGIRPIRELNPRVDRGLAEIIERCLANDPRDRPQTAAELLAALRKHRARFPRARRWVAAHAVFLLAVTLLGLASASTGIYFLVPKEPYGIRRLHAGLDRYRQGQFEEAILYLNQAIDADPTSVEARFARARAFQRLGHIESALADFEKADELANQQDGRIKACIAYCSGLHGDHEKAILHNHQARDLNFATAEVFNNLGYSYLQRRLQLRADVNFEQAQHCFDEAIKLNGCLQAPYYNRAILEIKRTSTSPRSVPMQGIADIRKAIDLGPSTALLFFDAARLCALASKRDPTLVPETFGYLEKAIDFGLPPKDMEADFLFHGLRTDPRFQALLKKPPRPDRFQNPQRLVDPIQE